MEIPIMYGALLIGVLLVILAIAKVAKSKKTGKAFLVIGLIGLAVAGAAYLNVLPQTYDSGAITTQQLDIVQQQPLKPVTTVCAVEDTTVTLSGQDKYTSVASGGTHRYRVNGAPALTVADAGTFTASPNDVVETLFGNETSGTYFGVVKKEVIECKGTQTIKAETSRNDSVTINVFNEEGNIISEGAENETIGSGETSNMKIELRATNDRGFPYGGTFIVELNGTDYKEGEVELSFVDLSVRKVNVPDASSVTNIANKEVAFEVSAFDEAILHSGTLTLVAESETNPGTANDPVIEFRPYDYFINEDTGGSFDGPAAEDEDNAWTFLHTTSFTIHVD